MPYNRMDFVAMLVIAVDEACTENFAHNQEHSALFTGRSSERRLGDISLCQPKGSSFDTHEYIDIITGLRQGLCRLLSCWHTEGAQQLVKQDNMHLCTIESLPGPQ